MTNLPQQLEGQTDTLTNDGTRFNKAESGHWYSPNAVARMIEEARMEEREACMKVCEYYAADEGTAEECVLAIRNRHNNDPTALNNIACIVAEMRSLLNDLQMEIAKYINDLEAALMAKENKRSQPN